jgi:hypothetical protein
MILSDILKWEIFGCLTISTCILHKLLFMFRTVFIGTIVFGNVFFSEIDFNQILKN